MEKRSYQKPEIASHDAHTIVEALGPAQGLASGVTGGPASNNPTGLGGSNSSPRHFGR